MILSACLLVIYLTFYQLRVYRKKKPVNAMEAKMTAMALGMLNSVLIGLLIGMISQGHLVISTIFSIILSFIVGAMIGRPLGGTAIIEAVCSSFMGAMMGAMLGEMVPPGDTKLILLFMDTLYIIGMSLMIIWMDSKEIPSTFNKTTLLYLVVIPILIVTSFKFIDFNQPKVVDQQHHHSMVMKQE